MISGLIGGLPITQVIVRSSANIEFGGKTKMSSIFHGVLLLIGALTIASILSMIPLASVAAILLTVGYELAKPSLFKQMLLTMLKIKGGIDVPCYKFTQAKSWLSVARC